MFKYIILLLCLLITIAIIITLTRNDSSESSIVSPKILEIQSIDTMKLSRDIAREKLNDPSYNIDIDTQVSNIAATGATHIALGTPYDDEFIPFLKRWVTAARKYELNVWYRGNMAGWEGWFDYPRIDRQTHKQQIVRFILNNPDIFEDGDLFSSCPECENGGPGDPRMNNDLKGHRTFIIEEYEEVKKAFATIDKDVQSNLFSMNGDVAELVMDRETTAALDGIVTIDHYVKEPERLIKDIRRIHKHSGGNIVLGEYGAPIPDIHGNMSDEEQAAWIRESLDLIAQEKSVIGINYWVNQGGSTRIWSDTYEPLPAVTALNNVFKPKILTGTVTRPSGRPISEITIQSKYFQTVTSNEKFNIPVIDEETIEFDKNRYIKQRIYVPDDSTEVYVIMQPSSYSFSDVLADFIFKLNPFR